MQAVRTRTFPSRLQAEASNARRQNAGLIANRDSLIGYHKSTRHATFDFWRDDPEGLVRAALEAAKQVRLPSCPHLEMMMRLLLAACICVAGSVHMHSTSPKIMQPC